MLNGPYGILYFSKSYTTGGDRMTGRNNKPDNDGPASSPSRLDQFGDKLASQNEEEFNNSAEQACEPTEDNDYEK
jgi:hypothetical protein